ncbi:hypothetical protein [Nitrosomonas sp. Nm166]|uniref:hypothetical protein n=1 Tax=Nitrosomonas sp. Nm166 TaxID=1881054 RepID=UPI00210C7ED5|nr:hypothetical protein [Nitrosomonas sp. Nm166]
MIEVHHLCLVIGQAHHLTVIPHGDEMAVGDGNSRGLWLLVVKRRELAIAED